ncbi:hypothetical protein BC826DRAFT_1102138 [Russula brevipes]|nr:hypothetical protein BC826DRAFT_1102138 [Russula brevipes]
MLVNRFHALLALVAIGGVSVQGQSYGFDDCGTACLATARTQTCSATETTNATCGCSDFTAFEAAVTTCVSGCTNSTGDQTALATLQTSLCGGNSTGNGTSTNGTSTGTGTSTSGTSTGTGTSTSHPTSTGTSTRTSTTSGTSGTSTPTSGASLLVQLPLLSAVVAIAGAAVVGAFA